MELNSRCILDGGALCYDEGEEGEGEQASDQVDHCLLDAGR